MIYEEQKKLSQQQAQIKSQMARYEDELARKRMQVTITLFHTYGFYLHQLQGFNCLFLTF